MYATPNPLYVAAAVNRTRMQTREQALKDQMNRRIQARSRGYHGPLTRAELAAQVSNA